MSIKYWLMKSEPSTFSINDLRNKPNQTDYWDGVRNYQARNYMRDEMKLGDEVLFYHSNCKEPGVVGLAVVSKEGFPDHTSWDPDSKYFDPKSTPDTPRWFMVELTWKEEFRKTVTLKELKEVPELSNMKVIQKGQRLSIQPVTEEEFKIVCQMGQDN